MIVLFGSSVTSTVLNELKVYLPILFRVTSVALGQSCDCPSANEVILKNDEKIINHQTVLRKHNMSTHYFHILFTNWKWHYNQKDKHNIVLLLFYPLQIPSQQKHIRYKDLTKSKLSMTQIMGYITTKSTLLLWYSTTHASKRLEEHMLRVLGKNTFNGI